MRDKKKVTDLFIELINYQLKDHGVTYEQVKGDPQWFMNYKTTAEKQQQFTDHIVERCKTVLGLNTKMAENEASWFILQWGLTLDVSQTQESVEQKPEIKRTKSS